MYELDDNSEFEKKHAEINEEIIFNEDKYIQAILFIIKDNDKLLTFNKLNIFLFLVDRISYLHKGFFNSKALLGEAYRLSYTIGHIHYLDIPRSIKLKKYLNDLQDNGTINIKIYNDVYNHEKPIIERFEILNEKAINLDIFSNDELQLLKDVKKYYIMHEYIDIEKATHDILSFISINSGYILRYSLLWSIPSISISPDEIKEFETEHFQEL